jgi:hypothetical protein
MTHKPYTKAEFENLVKQGEARLGLHNFIIPQVVIESMIKQSVTIAHASTCYCMEVCFNAKLDALVTTTEKNLVDSKKAVSQDNTVDDVVWKD